MNPLEELRALLDGRELSELSNEELARAQQLAIDAFDAARAAEGGPDLDVMREIAAEGGIADTLTAEQTVRDEAAAALEAEAAQLAERLGLASDTGGEPEGGEADEPETEPEGGEPETAPETEPTAETVTTEAQPEPVAAAAAPAARPTLAAVRRQQPADARRVPEPKRERNRIMLDGGAEATSFRDVAQAMVDRQRSFLSMMGGVKEFVRVARIEAEYPEDRQLSSSDPYENDRRIREAGAGTPEALVAAGGLCAPVAPYYGIAQIADDERPVRGGLAGFGADRGGIRFVEPPVLSDASGAMTTWTEANDTTPAAPATKACLVVPCGATIEVVVRAVVKCLQFGNFAARTDPEQVESWNDLTMAAFARHAEGLLLDDIKAGSTAVTGTAVFGASRDVLGRLDQLVAGYRSRHRMRDNVRLRVMLPSWVRDMIRLDLLRGPTATIEQASNFAVADATIEQFFTRRNISVSWYLDTPSTGTSQVFAAQGAGAIIEFPGAIQGAIFHEGAWLFLDGGQLDLGLVRDSTLNETNDFQMFAETFEGAAFVGVESLWFTLTTEPNGVYADAIDASLVTG